MDSIKDFMSLAKKMNFGPFFVEQEETDKKTKTPKSKKDPKIKPNKPKSKFLKDVDIFDDVEDIDSKPKKKIKVLEEDVDEKNAKSHLSLVKNSGEKAFKYIMTGVKLIPDNSFEKDVIKALSPLISIEAYLEKKSEHINSKLRDSQSKSAILALSLVTSYLCKAIDFGLKNNTNLKEDKVEKNNQENIPKAASIFDTKMVPEKIKVERKTRSKDIANYFKLAGHKISILLRRSKRMIPEGAKSPKLNLFGKETLLVDYFNSLSQALIKSSINLASLIKKHKKKMESIPTVFEGYYLLAKLLESLGQDLKD